MGSRHSLVATSRSSVRVNPAALPRAQIFFAAAGARRAIDNFAANHHDGKPWLLVRFARNATHIGPYFKQGSPPCWFCLRYWLDLRPRERSGPFRRITIPSDPEQLIGTVLSFDATGRPIAQSRVLQRPHCPNCGDPTTLLAPGFPRIVFSDEAPPVDFERFMDPTTGVVTSLVSRSPVSGFSAVMAGSLIPGAEKSKCYGAGPSENDARRSAIAEALERYSLGEQGYEARLNAAFERIEGSAILPGQLHAYSDRQYRMRKKWNAAPGAFPFIPPPYRGQPMDWAPAWSITGQRLRLLPFDYCYWRRSQGPEPPWCIADSIGCAAGRSSVEAFDRALLEAVERDAVAIWWANRLPLRLLSVDLEAPEWGLEPEITALRAMRRTYAVFDLTTDLGIPVAGAISWDRRQRLPDFGFGAAADFPSAIKHAMRELTQTAIVNHATRNRRMSESAPGVAFHHWRAAARQGQETYLGGKHTEPPAGSKTPPLEAFSNAGIEVIALNISRPEIGLPVIRVACPGLCHPWLRLGASRLFEAPVRMGLLQSPNAESDLNPLPFAL